MRKISTLLLALLCLSLQSCCSKNVTTISSIEELLEVAAKSNQTIKMKEGVYQLADYLTDEIIAATPYSDKMNRKAMILFSGSNNSFDFSGVTIEVDTRLLGAFGSSINEIQITGEGNTIKGLTLTDIENGHPTRGGARSFVVTGDYNKIDGVTINAAGSFPYNYGDLLGKGDELAAPSLNKHSAMLIEGLADTILNCSIYSKSFGHLFFVQGGRDVYFENCYAQAAIRSTDDMLAETSGLLHDIDFRSVYGNYEGTKRVMPNYMKSLSECGFRNYGSGGPEKNRTGSVTLVNCHAKNTRIGFAFTRGEEEMNIIGCQAEGCEVAYYLGGVNVKDSRGDAMYGPLLTLCKSRVPSNIELQLTSCSSNYTIHGLALINGENHTIKLSPYNGELRESALPIRFGIGGPSANNGYSPVREGEASGITIENTTGMPIVLNDRTSSCTVVTNGEVSDKGKSNVINR